MSFDVYTIDLNSINLSLTDLIQVKHGAGTAKYVPMEYLNIVSDLLNRLIKLCGDDETSITSMNFDEIEEYLLRIRGDKK